VANYFVRKNPVKLTSISFEMRVRLDSLLGFSSLGAFFQQFSGDEEIFYLQSMAKTNPEADY
jgi:hypothetical protein